MGGRGETGIAAVFGIFIAALAFYFYRGLFLAPRDGVFGDYGDARILIAILEHWHLWFSGKAASWADPGYFYPAKGVLGLTDAYFLYALPYTLGRWAGFDPYLSFMFVMLLLSAIGTATFFVLARLLFSVSVPAALVGAGLFAFANMVAFKMGHAQSYCAMLLPLVLIFVVLGVRRKQPLWLVLAGILLGLIFFTAYLTGWFFLSFAMFATAIFILLGGRERIRSSYETLRGHASLAISFAVGFAVSLVPFFMLYVPVALRGLRRSPYDTLIYAPRFTDIINVGPDNLVWGSLLKSIGIAGVRGRPLAEVELGFSPVFFAALILFILFYYRSRNRQNSLLDDLMIALGAAVVVYWLVQINVFGDTSLWFAVYWLTPGASGVRTTFRAQIVTNLAACLVVAVAIDRMRQWTRFVWPVVLFVGFLFLEQVNPKAPSLFRRGEQTAWLATFTPPPARCHAFFLAPSERKPIWWRHQSDAMILSAMLHIPTINGNSSWRPEYWDFPDPAAPSYKANAADWVRRNGLETEICTLNPDSKTWSMGLT